MNYRRFIVKTEDNFVISVVYSIRFISTIRFRLILRTLLFLMILFFLLVLEFPPALAEVSSVITDKHCYIRSENIIISGAVDRFTEKPVNIVITNSVGTQIFLMNSYVSSGNTFVTLPFGIDDVVKGRRGTYITYAYVDGISHGKSTKFTFENCSETSSFSGNPVPIQSLETITSDEISMLTDKFSYVQGETIILSGSVEKWFDGFQVTIQIRSPAGKMIKAEQIPVAQDHKFREAIQTGDGQFKDSGTYSLRATYGPKVSLAQITFQFDSQGPTTGVPNQPKGEESTSQPKQVESPTQPREAESQNPSKGSSDGFIEQFTSTSNPIVIVLVIGAGIGSVVVIFILLRKSFCKHDWQITYQNKQNSFFCIKCGKRALGTRTYRRRNVRRIGIILGLFTIFLIGLVLFYPNVLSSYLTNSNFSTIQIPKQDEFSNMITQFLKVIGSSIQFTEEWILENNLLVIFSIIVMAVGIGIVYFVKSKKEKQREKIAEAQRQESARKEEEERIKREQEKEKKRRQKEKQREKIAEAQRQESARKEEEERIKREQEREKKRERGEQIPRPGSSQSFDPYQELGVPRSITCEGLKERHKELVKKHHRGGTATMSKDEFKKWSQKLSDINRAREMIREEKGCRNW